MPAAEQSILIEQGATFIFQFTLRDANNDPIDITGSSFKMQLREKLNSETPLITLETGDEIDVVSAPGGVVRITIPHTVTSTFTGKKYVYDLFWEDSLGVVRKLFKGDAENDLAVTRPSTL